MNVLLTGSTGTVGRTLIPILEARGFRLFHIARPKGKGAYGRLKELVGEPYIRHDNCFDGDVTEPYCGISKAHRESLRQHGISAMFHAAGSISFDETREGESDEHNIKGTENAIVLAKDIGIESFNYLSTAYVAGNRVALHENDGPRPTPPNIHNNIYEATKASAENLARLSFAEGCTVFRMSIMIGDSKTAQIPSFNGYYGFFAAFWALKQSLIAQWNTEGKRSRLKENGIEIHGSPGEEIIRLPIHVSCSDISTLNLIPADWFGSTVATILEQRPHGKTFHVVHPNPPRVKMVIDASLKHLGFEGYTSGSEKHERSSVFQTMVDRGIKAFTPYITHGPLFSCTSVTETCGAKYEEPPLITEEFLGRMLTYATKVNFGRR